MGKIQNVVRGMGGDCLISREGGDIGLFITLVPKVLYKHFLIRLLHNFGDLSEF